MAQRIGLVLIWRFIWTFFTFPFFSYSGPSSDASSPVAPCKWKSGLKASTSLHQELNDSLFNMRTVEQQLHCKKVSNLLANLNLNLDMENILFGRGGGSTPGGMYEHHKSSTETDYLQELERINNELKGFVPIGATSGGTGCSDRDGGTAVSLISTEATDSGVDPASLMAERGSNDIDTISMDTTNGAVGGGGGGGGSITRSNEEPVFPNGEFY